jgi:DNA-binding CsgD family transcriptional regulator
MTTGVSTAFVGRTGELERLRECAAALASNAGAVVLLEGDAGAGKTRLLEELKPAATGGALEYVQAPYAPVRDLLIALDARFPEVLKKDPALTCALRPVLNLSTHSEEPLEQRKVLDAIVSALAKYSAAGPVIAAIEDAHWIDRASAAVVAHIARETPQMALLFVVTYRGTDAMQREESRALIAQLTRCARIAIPLKPLSDAETMALIAEASSGDLPLALRRSICELAQGNPLLILELTRHAEQDPSRFESGLPVSLQALVHDRIARFSESERDVLRVCAALETFDTKLVAEIAGVDAPVISGTLRKARGEHIVDETAGRFRFRHALIRRAITDEILGIELADLHARIATRLRSEAPSSELHARLAHHYWMAGDAVNCERYNVVAAEDALRVQAYDDAAAFYERAIGDRGVDRTTCALWSDLASAYEASARYRQAVDAHRKIVAFARAHLSAAEAARAGMALSRACFYAMDDEGSISAARDALAALPPDAPRELRFELSGLLGWYLVHLRRLDEASTALAQAAQWIDAAQAVPLIRYHEAMAALDVHSNRRLDWREHMQRALEIADTLDDATRIHRYTNAMALAGASNLDEFRLIFDLFDRVKPSIEKIEGSAWISVYGAVTWSAYLCGKLTETRAILDALLPYVNDTAVHAYRTVATGIPLALRTGDQRLLNLCMRPRVLEDAFASKDPVVFGHVAAAVAEYFLSQGRAGEAIALIDRTIGKITDAGNNLDFLIIAGRFGSQKAVQRAKELLLPWASKSRSAAAAMLLVQAHHERGTARREHARRSAAGFAALPWPVYQAQALELAGDLEQAQEIYAGIGAFADAARVAEQRSGSGAQLFSLLSPRESEVAEFVADGLSNRAIAEKLNLSERTVENHIGSIFNKLSLRSRVEIASLVSAARGKRAAR